MIVTCNKFYRILICVLALVILVGLVGVQALVSPVAAQSPEDTEPVLSILIIPDGEGFRVAGVSTPPVFNVGDTFKVSVVALGVTEPGIFGGQFEITYDTNYLTAVEDSLVSGTALEPVVVALANIDNSAGLVQYVASRKGNLDNVSGNVTLASFRFEAVGATEPPEGQTTVIHLQNVKLGAKGGIEVPVSGLVDLEVIIKAEDNAGDIVGNVKVEARAADNQAGHEVTAVGSSATLSTTTNINGDFLFDNAPADTYDVTADSPGFLAATCTDVVHTADALTTLLDVTLLAGDIDNNGVIDITDAVAIGAAFGTTNEVADLNGDGVVDILDLILMAVNFDQDAAGNPWNCQ